jgi:16S rRNA (cytosine967-C5)-methyltransferase
MSRFHSYLSSAAKLVDSYSKGSPLVHHLKKFFSEAKKYGSRDRKMIATLCYHYFRVARALPAEQSTQQKIIHSLFLCEKEPVEILAVLDPSLNEQVSLPVKKKLAMLGIGPEGIFPFSNETGDGIDVPSFILSLFSQPAVYLRTRPGKMGKVTGELEKAGISADKLECNCIKVPNATALDKVIRINKDVVIQDRNSQRVFDLISKDPALFSRSNATTVWDCCAASGGKALLLYDLLGGDCKLTVSDVRPNILLNLKQRLQQAGIPIYKNFTADLSLRSGLSADDRFDLITCDAPCTGSGTWARTPEQLFSFKHSAIDEFALKQQQIVSAVIPHLGDNGIFFYITCSVFKRENEGIAGYIKEKFHLQLLQMEYLNGYNEAADTMFVAAFRK